MNGHCAFAASWLVVAIVGWHGLPASHAEPPREWIEPETGRRVVRLSDEPGSRSLYFHDYAYSSDGRKVVMTTPSGIAAADLESHSVDLIVSGRVRLLMTGRKSGDAYYIREGAVYAAKLDDGESRHITDLPAGLRSGNVVVNCDETMIVGTAVDPQAEPVPREIPPGHSRRGLARRWSAGLPMVLYTIDLDSGETSIIHRSHDWLNHLQCSPTDPHQIMFCHEGPWHYVDRIWLIRSDGSGLTQVHPRTMDMEIAGHEFFSADGRTVWYDLQTPRSLVFWLAGYEVATGKRTWYHARREAWSVHYVSSPDGKLFAGDGGGPDSVANRTPTGEPLDPPGNGQWIYLFHPEMVRMTGLPEQAAGQVQVGVLRAERLVDLSQHDYRLEPNATFTPDGKSIVFRSNLHGPAHVYAVEIARSVTKDE